MSKGRTLALAVLGSAALWCQDTTTGQAAAESTLDRIGALPVRFDGRLWTFEEVARWHLRFVSGRDWIENGGERTSATSWLLERIANPQESMAVPLFPVNSPDLLELMDITDSDEAGVRLSPSQFGQHWEALPEPEFGMHDLFSGRASDLEREAVILMTRAFAYAVVVETLRMVPPVAEGGPWQSLVSEAPDEPENPARALVYQMFEAYRTGPRHLEDALSSYEAYLQKSDPFRSPLHYDVPDGWLPIPVEEGPRAFFSDIQTLARKAASFYVGDPLDCSGGIVFASGATDLDALLDSWRVDCGRPPRSALPEAERPPRNPLGIDREGAVSFHATVPDEVSRLRKHGLGAAWTDPAGTWVVTLRGPPTRLDAQLASFQKFVASIAVGSRAEILDWLPDLPEPPPTPPWPLEHQGMVLLGEGPRLWVVQSHCLPGMADFDSVLQQLLASLTPRRRVEPLGYEHDGLGGEPPAGWSEEASPFFYSVYRFERDEAMATAGVNCLTRVPEEGWRHVVNTMRRAISLEPLSEEAWARLGRRQQAGDLTILVVASSDP